MGEEGFELGGRFLHDFTEHPAGGFMDEVVGVIEEELSDSEGIGEVVLAYESVSGDDGDAAFPEGGATGELVKDIAGFMEEELADDIACGEINDVPVIDERGMLEVSCEDGLMEGGGRFFKLEDPDEEGEAAFFVVGGFEELEGIFEGELREGFSEFTEGWDGDAEEFITFGVLAFSGFKEGRECFCFFRIYFD